MTGPLLRVSNLSKSFDRNGFWRTAELTRGAVVDVSVEVEAGQTLGIVGESGSGKTTLVRLIARLIEADSGTIEFSGMDLLTLSAPALRKARRRMQIVPQDPTSAFDPRVRAGAAIAGVIRLHRLRAAHEIAARVMELIDQVGLSPDLQHRFPHELSGGQLQRLAIAQALAVEPDLILLDEVASALDVLVKDDILRLLRQLQHDHGKTYIFISHDIRDVFRMSDTVGVMFEGRVVEQGPRQSILAYPRHPYTRDLLACAAGSAPISSSKTALARNAPLGCCYAPRCSVALPDCHLQEPLNQRIENTAQRVACSRSSEFPPEHPFPDWTKALSPKALFRLDLMIKAAVSTASNG